MRTRAGLAGLLVSATFLVGPLTSPAAAEPAAAITPGNVLIRFDTSSPGTITDTKTVTGLGANETVRGIDVRPADGLAYIVTVTTGAASNSKLYTYRLNVDTGVATKMGETVGPVPGAGDVPTGWDFNPTTTDLVRYVNTNDENARINSNTGALAVDDANLTPAATTTVIAETYDRNRGGASATTLYAIDRNDSQLSIQGGINGAPNPSGGIITDLAPLGFNLNQANDGGLDASPTGNAYAALTDAADNLTRLYTVTLFTGLTAQPAAAPVGLIGNGQTEVRTLAILAADADGDGVLNGPDNCLLVFNPDQANNEGDAQGDACDDDDDNDGRPTRESWLWD